MAPLDEAMRLSPRDPMKFWWLALYGLAAFGMERYEEALEWAKKSIAENKEFPTAYRLMAT